MIYETQYDQFLLSCSDDGLVHVYDVSSFDGQAHDEFYVKESEKTFKIYSSIHCSSDNRSDPLLVMKEKLL